MLAGASFGLRVWRFEEQVDPQDPLQRAAIEGAPGSVLPFTSTGTPTGDWVARGQVLSSLGAGDQPAGTRFTRRWQFSTHCSGPTCTTQLARTNAYRQVDSAPLRVLNGYLNAAFTLPSNGCTAGGPGQLRRAFIISVNATGRHLEAFEIVAGVYPGCGRNGRDGTIFSTVRRHADRVGARRSYASFPRAIARRSIVAS